MFLELEDILLLFPVFRKGRFRFPADIIQLVIVGLRFYVHHPFLKIRNQELLVHHHGQKNGHDEVEGAISLPVQFFFPLFHGSSYFLISSSSFLSSFSMVR